MPRLFVIGDIHGHHAALASLLEWIAVDSGDTVITLGDHISGGPGSKGVIDELLHLGKRARVISLLGNHELLMQRALRSREFCSEWLTRGGDSVLASYGNCPLVDIPAAHWSFIKSCRRFYENHRFIFVHGVVDPRLPMKDQSDDKLFWEKLTGNLNHCSGKTIICGHTPQRTGVPLRRKGVICIDTDIKGNGWLTCLEPATGRYWQANPKGKRRKATL